MRNRRFFQLWPLLASLVLLLSLSGPAGAARQGLSGQVGGWVRQADGRGIAGARVEVGQHVIQTDQQGTIPSTAVPLDRPSTTVTVVVRAPGFAEWRYEGVRLSATHRVTLQVVLGTQPTIIQPDDGGGAVDLADGPPDYINVGRTFSTNCVYPPTNVQRVDRMPFMDYVRNVLPNEWVGTWPAASLDAGAVAISQYAWSVAFVQRKWTRYNYSFDVLDSTCDQVYKDRDPSRSYSTTDAAVSRMWGTALLRNGMLFPTFYRAYDTQCGANLDCMGQYGSRDRANQGETGPQILQHYYSRRGAFTAAATAPAQRGLLLRRLPDVVVRPGHPQTLTVCLRNAGTTTWQQGVTDLGVVDPADPNNIAYSSPLADPGWRSPQRPATLTQPSVALGQNGSWSFTISAPPSLAPGTYRLAVRPIQAGQTSWIATDMPIVWTVVVQPPTALTARVWLPVATGPSSATGCS